MRLRKIGTACILVFVIAFTGCIKDEENPVIYVSDPIMHAEYNYGDMIQVEATFTDDVDLAKYFVEIGDENGEHLSDFHNDDSGDISGVVHRYSAMITIPDSLMMDMFYLHFTVSDMSGKSSTEKVMLHINEDVHNHTH